jgi:WD40 repeat protein
VNFPVTSEYKVVRFFIQKLYFYYSSSVHKTKERYCILESEISAMLMIDEHALFGTTEGHLQLIDSNTAPIIRQMNRHTNRITCIVYCSELSMMITGSTDKTARVWNVATDVCIHVLIGHTSAIFCAAVHNCRWLQ